MSEQTEVKSCCTTGHLHEGTPVGSMQTVHGFNTYVSEPKDAGEGKVNTFVFIPDIFGIYPNAKLVCDEWAGQGYRVLMPDVIEGEPIPHDMLNTIVPNNRKKAEATAISKAADTAKMGAAIGPWIVANREAVVKPKIEQFVQAVRADPKTGKLAALGFCWGGRYALILAQEESPARVDLVVANHPSFLSNDDVKSIKTVPVAIFKGSNDDMMDQKALDEVSDILRNNLHDKYHVQVFPEAVHGFTIRGDTEDPQEKKDKEAANEAAFEFAKRWLN